MLHKHPDKLQSVDLSVGKAHIFYSEKREDRTTICILLDIDPIEMVRGSKNLSGDGFTLGNYVNDRPYVASSFLSAALVKAFSTAMNGKCKEKPELVEEKIPFEIFISSIPIPKGGEILIRKFFEPLGYEVELLRHGLDKKFPEWGESKYYNLNMRNIVTTKDLLSHLYVLIPALDNNKHYFVNEDEIEKLLQKGEGWLKSHPEKEQITRRYLINLNSLSRKALERLNEGEDDKAVDDYSEVSEQKKVKESFHEKRLKFVADKLIESGAERVLDLGCGEGKLIRHLMKQKQFSEIVGIDVSYSELLKAKERLKFEEMAPKQKERVKLIQGSLTYKDNRLEGYDAAAVVEVIEHLDLNRLDAFEKVIFQCAKPKTVILTTPNKEYNVVWETLDSEEMRHDDHRFEWTRKEFEDWSSRIGLEYNYRVELLPVGDEVESVGAPSQMAIFTYGN
ncbi:3' terminal RNA ribose 2'-O-methyltransferase Hen1 [Leptospira alstonii serovar Pingchang str. 80-412]|uniref:Small RNA 2'-O-methyltransferase n=2 Tax=Leptospira alstonii TaxID=28452 RepID=M6CFR2_9LEPT|nr:3' terminal RNA ribose 2'-O-methyltransferase Hen1 [Leptospira alstonii serovar Sichuan str. 79601]EQA82076.1 3' terminal RNA ribose 2'-O-methyltransferase Hen1 [Leptospira alstonii serovar Pingchang str. 80-412]